MTAVEQFSQNKENILFGMKVMETDHAMEVEVSDNILVKKISGKDGNYEVHIIIRGKEEPW